MLRPRKMKYIELTVFKTDMDAVLQYLGRLETIQFPEKHGTEESPEVTRILRVIDRLITASDFLGFDFHDHSSFAEFNENFFIPNEDEENFTETFCSKIEELKTRKIKAEQERKRITETINEAKAFAKMNMPFSQLEQLTFLTLRLGRVLQKNLHALREELGERAVIIPLENPNASANIRIIAASSKKGRFALDSTLKKYSYEPIAFPEDQKGVPAEMFTGLEEQLSRVDDELKLIKNEKENLRKTGEENIARLLALWNNALTIEGIKSRFTVTENLYHFTGWIPADISMQVVDGLKSLTGGRIAIKTYSPDEVPSIKDGTEKVPVCMKHRSFVRGFEGVVFSYGAPLYGTIDPTPLVALFFTILFGLMFGDVGQGFILLLIGFATKYGGGIFKKFTRFSTPLIAVGIASMLMGLLTGAVFTNEQLLVPFTRAVTGAVTGNPVDRILHILPMASEGGSMQKMLFFFGFTVSIGVMLNSAGLLINIINRCILKKYEAAFFSKTGLAGLLMFWYALFIVIRIILGGRFVMLDLIGLLTPVFCIFFGPVIWRIIARERPVLEHGLMTFIMEGFVEVLETVSTYVSNTVSFLRVGAFALSHAVLSFIVFRFSEEMYHSGFTGTISAILIMILGNVIIIVLEGMIVAIQVVRLQYYEFFNKFFIETGVEFAPFRFKKRN